MEVLTEVYDRFKPSYSCNMCNIATLLRCNMQHIASYPTMCDIILKRFDDIRTSAK